MKLKLTNSFNSDIIELEGLPNELAAFMAERRDIKYLEGKKYQGIGADIVATWGCLHDIDYNDMFPFCKKCYQPFCAKSRFLPVNQPEIFYLQTTTLSSLDQ